MEIEIKHSKPETQQEKKLREKYKDKPTRFSFILSIVTLLIALSQVYFYIYNQPILFFGIPLVVISICFKNIQYATYGGGKYKAILSFLSMISIFFTIATTVIGSMLLFRELIRTSF